MALLRINADGQQPVLHRSPQDLRRSLDAIFAGQDTPSSDKARAPVIVMTHGYRFTPEGDKSCPHRHILSTRDRRAGSAALSWPRRLGFGRAKAHEGDAVAFGWSAQGNFQGARARAEEAGAALAKVITEIKARAPGRAVHILTHSLGAHVALAAMARLATGDLGRVVVMNPAAYQSQAQQALAAAAGATARLITVTSRENAFYDRLFETFARREIRGDRAMGRGVVHPNAVTLQLDRAPVLAALSEVGFPIAPPMRRVCHWSPYLRPGVFPFYRALFRGDGALTVRALRTALAEAENSAAERARARELAAFPLPTP